MNRPDFYSLYLQFSHDAMATWEQEKLDESIFLGDMALLLIGAEVDRFMSQRLLPQRAESRQQEFGYISEDDGQYHATRRIDWDYLLG